MHTIPVYALTFMLGIACLQYSSTLADVFWVSLLPLFLLLVVFNRNFKLPVIFIIGFLWALLQAHLYTRHVLPENLAGQSILVQGVITGIPYRDGRVQRFMLEITSYVNANTVIDQSAAAPKIIKLSWYDQQQSLQSGQLWQLLVRLKPPHGFMNPGGFDYERWLYQNGIHATGYVKNDESNQLVSTSSGSIDRLRQRIVDYISRLDADQPDIDFIGLIEALAVGHKSAISADQWLVLTRTGTSHLMAISGLHIGLIAAWVFWIGRYALPAIVLKFIPSTQFAALLALIAAGFYASLAGFAIPTQRAMIMLSVVLGALLLRRNLKPLNSLSWALIIVLLIEPASILAAGFWFSFMAVAVIAYCFSGRLQQSRGWLQWGRLQAVIALALFPLSVFLFQQTSLVAPLANLILVPWVSIIVVPLVLIACLSMGFSTTLADWLFRLADSSFALIWPALHWLSQQSMASWQQAQIPMVYVLLGMAGTALLLAPKGLTHRWLGLIMVIPCIFYRPDYPQRGNVWIDVLDVGQGLAVIIQTQHHALAYDMGPRLSAKFDTGEQVIVPFLKSRDISRLDKMIVSHGDNDHIGGAESLLSQLQVIELLGQGIDELVHNNKKACLKGQKWQWDGIDFEILHPDQLYRKANNRSCVLRINNAKASVLITADIEKKVEQRLVKYHPEKLNSGLLIVPHHGSKTSSSIDFIKTVDPDYAIVSAGYKNRFQHPVTEILSRYQAVGIKIYNTAMLGAIHITLNSETGLSAPQSYRTKMSHYWNHGQL